MPPLPPASWCWQVWATVPSMDMPCEPSSSKCLGRSLARIGLEETYDGIWAIHFNTVLLATFDERDHIIAG